jgi:hypothetical protein
MFPGGPEPVFVNLLRSPGIDSQPGGPGRYDNPLSYRPAMQHRLAESNSRSRFLVSLNVYRYELGTQPYVSYRPARLHRLDESVLVSLNVYKYGLRIRSNRNTEALI